MEYRPGQHQQRAGGIGKVEVAVVVIGPALGMFKVGALTANKVQDAMSAGYWSPAVTRCRRRS
ncbi:MAG: hypothetical protein IPL72_00810 [Sulfuritalea sp.]|nr:hypothetical protein [Sulfuritalea sp.]